MTMQLTIYFYRGNEAWGEFSNFAPFPVALDGKLWPTAEHGFQAQKFEDPDFLVRIRCAELPMTAASLGRSRQRKRRSG